MCFVSTNLGLCWLRGPNGRQKSDVPAIHVCRVAARLFSEEARREAPDLSCDERRDGDPFRFASMNREHKIIRSTKWKKQSRHYFPFVSLYISIFSFLASDVEMVFLSVVVEVLFIVAGLKRSGEIDTRMTASASC